MEPAKDSHRQSSRKPGKSTRYRNRLQDSRSTFTRKPWLLVAPRRVRDNLAISLTYRRVLCNSRREGLICLECVVWPGATPMMAYFSG
jgi:hypothetical protein